MGYYVNRSYNFDAVESKLSEILEQHHRTGSYQHNTMADDVGPIVIIKATGKGTVDLNTTMCNYTNYKLKMPDPEEMASAAMEVYF